MHQINIRKNCKLSTGNCTSMDSLKCESGRSSLEISKFCVFTVIEAEVQRLAIEEYNFRSVGLNKRCFNGNINILAL